MKKEKKIFIVHGDNVVDGGDMARRAIILSTFYYLYYTKKSIMNVLEDQLGVERHPGLEINQDISLDNGKDTGRRWQRISLRKRGILMP